MKTARQLLAEAARLMSRATKAHAAGDSLILREEEAEDLLKDVQQWLQEELDEASLADGVRPSEDVEPPTDERLFAAYLRGIEAWGRIWQGSKFESPVTSQGAFARLVADNALAAAREQAKEPRA